jgi:mono/diheme cytochrome c family protein
MRSKLQAGHCKQVESKEKPRRRRTATTALFYFVLSAFYGLAFTGCSSTRPATPIAQLSPVEYQGYRDFQARCAQCHHDRTTGPLHGPSLKGVFQKQSLPSGAPANDDRVTATIEHGRGMMPAQNDLDDQQTAAIVAYLHTL